MNREDLVVVAVPGVQQFLTWSRTTADVAGASAIVSRLVRAAAAAVAGFADVIMPSIEGTSTPNRLVVTTRAGQGHDVAIQMKVAVEGAWAAEAKRVAERCKQETRKRKKRG